MIYMKTNPLLYAAGLACACAFLEFPRRRTAMVRLVMAITRAFRRPVLH